MINLLIPKKTETREHDTNLSEISMVRYSLALNLLKTKKINVALTNIQHEPFFCLQIFNIKHFFFAMCAQEKNLSVKSQKIYKDILLHRHVSFQRILQINNRHQ